MFIDASSKVINLQELLLITHQNTHVLVKKATIFWIYDIIDQNNNKLTCNGVKKILDPGY